MDDDKFFLILIGMLLFVFFVLPMLGALLVGLAK